MYMHIYMYTNINIIYIGIYIAIYIALFICIYVFIYMIRENR